MLSVNGTQITRGHSAFGDNAQIDTGWSGYASPIVLSVGEKFDSELTATGAGTGMQVIVQQHPTAPPANYSVTTGLNVLNYIDATTAQNYSNGLMVGAYISAADYGTGSISDIVSLYVDAQNDTGTVGSIKGMSVGVSNTGAGTVANGYGVYVASPLGGSAIGNYFGLYLADQTSAGGTTNYAMYSAGSGKAYFGGNVGIGSLTPASRLSIVGTTNDASANALMAVNLAGSPLLTVANSGIVAIGQSIDSTAALQAQSLSLPGAATLSTVGTSTTVTTTGNAFAGVGVDAAITANGTTRYVAEKVDNNTVIVDTAVNWSAGYSFTYKNSSLIAVNGSDADVRGFSINEGGATRWQLYSWHNEASKYVYLWNEIAKKDILTISEAGRMGINMPTVTTGAQDDAPADLAVYPTAFDKVYFYDSGSTTYLDFTDALTSSEDATVPQTIVPNADYVYDGMERQFDSIFVNLKTPLTSGTLKVEYWNGASWVLIGAGMGFADGTAGSTKSGVVSWDASLLSGWTPTTVSGTTLYWVRLSWTSATGTIEVSSLSPDAGLRFAAFQANGDIFPAFTVNGYGHVALGNMQRPSRALQASGDGSVSPLSVIDQAASLRLWNYSTTGAPVIEMISGTASLTNNLEWSMHAASATDITGAEGFWIERHIPGAGIETPILTLGRDARYISLGGI
jgi:hypothetical protein